MYFNFKGMAFDQLAPLLTHHIQFRKNYRPKTLLILLSAILKKAFPGEVKEIHFYTGEVKRQSKLNYHLQWQPLTPIKTKHALDPVVEPGNYLGQLELVYKESSVPSNKPGWIKVIFDEQRRFSAQELLNLETIRRNFSYILNQIRFDSDTNQYRPFRDRSFRDRPFPEE